MFCVALPWPFVVGALVVVSMRPEGLQALTPDRSSNLLAAMYGAGPVVTVALLLGASLERAAAACIAARLAHIGLRVNPSDASRSPRECWPF
jgi:hypothetical protein